MQYSKRHIVFCLLLLCALPFSAQANALSKTLSKASALMAQGEFDEARKTLNKLIISHPNTPEAYNNLAVLEAKLGNKKVAKALLEQALSTNRAYKLAYSNITKLNTSLALDAYKKTLNLTGTDQQVALSAADKALSPPQHTTQVIEKPTEIEKIVYVDKPVEKIVEKIVYVDKPIEKIVYVDRPIKKTTELSIKQKNTASPTLNDAKNLALNWAKAWENRNVDDYVNSYTSNFSNVQSGRHDDWIRHRTSRITTPKYIKIKLSNILLKRLSDDVATVTFLQNYQSDRLNDTVKKQLRVHVVDGQWKIQQESIIR